MKKRLASVLHLPLKEYLLSVVLVFATTFVLFFIGRSTIGEAGIALLYLLPVSMVAARWGQGPGSAAALTAALSFDYFFIPPFYTFNIGSPEGWLVLVIFMIMALVIIGRIQAGFSQARQREVEAIFMYELASALARAYTRDEIAHALAEHLQQLFQLKSIKVTIYKERDFPEMTLYLPDAGHLELKADRIIPIELPGWLAGEIDLWGDKLPLPANDSRLFQSYATQAAFAIERAQFCVDRKKI